VQAKVTESKDLLQQLINDLRSMSVTLNSENLGKLGLTELIQRDLERVNRSGFLNAHFELNGESWAFESSTEVIIYRIFQELLNNVLKHSGATKLQVELNFSGDIFTMLVKDNGIGLPQNPKFGSGLSNVRKRCGLIGAQQRIVEVEGCAVELTLPREINK
jgi:signal transduction histidine kinase